MIDLPLMQHYKRALVRNVKVTPQIFATYQKISAWSAKRYAILIEQKDSSLRVKKILTAYKEAISQVKLWGSTNTAPIINLVADSDGKSQTPNSATNYYITDGIVTDMDATREAIVNASNFPMSVIMVGVGNADFTALKFLDSDKMLFRSPGEKTAARDIVQFVPFRNFKMASAKVLTNQVLAEIPKQLLEYFSSQDLLPPTGKAIQNSSL